jgi:hypothetical protein
MQGQGGDYNGIQNIISRNNNLYKTTVPVPPKSTPATDAVAPADQDAQGQFDGEYVDPALAESRNTAEGSSDLSSARSSGTDYSTNRSRAELDAPNTNPDRGPTAAENAAMMDQIRREQAATDPNWKLSGTSR